MFLFPSLACLLHANNGILEILTCQLWKIKLANFGNSNLPILEIINLPTLDITKLSNFGNYRICPFWNFFTKFGLINLPISVAIKASSFKILNWNSIPQLKVTFATLKGHGIYATFGNNKKLLVIHFWSSSKSCQFWQLSKLPVLAAFEVASFGSFRRFQFWQLWKLPKKAKSRFIKTCQQWFRNISRSCSDMVYTKVILCHTT